MKNPMGRGAWWDTIQRVSDSGTTEQLNTTTNSKLLPKFLLITHFS